MNIRIAALLFGITGLGFAQTPVFNGTSVVNAAGFQNPVAPGSLISIFGTNLASTTAQADTIPLSTSLGGVTVQFVQGGNNFNAPMLFASPGSASASSQLNLQVPWELVPGGGNVTAIVTVNGNASAPQQINVGPLGPGVFESNGLAIAVNNLDGTLAWQAGVVPGLTTHAAKAGDVLVIYATGLGAVDTQIPDGQAPANFDNKLRNNTTPPTVLVGGVQAQLIYSVLSPQFVGVNQLAIFVPSGVTPGNNVPLQIQEGGLTSPNTTTIAIGQ